MIKTIYALLLLCLAFGLPGHAAFKGFSNPTKLNQSVPCSADNVNDRRFGISYIGESYSAKDKVRVCKGIDLFLGRSRNAEAQAGPVLLERMHTLWGTFVDYEVKVYPLPKELQKGMFVASAAFPRRVRAERFQAAIYIPAERVERDLFFYAFWHELQHVQDIKTAWEKSERVTNYELEFNGFYTASLLAEVCKCDAWQTGQPAFWNEEWKTLSPNEQQARRAAAIDQYIMSSEVLKDAWDKTQADYDFSGKR